MKENRKASDLQKNLKKTDDEIANLSQKLKNFI